MSSRARRNAYALFPLAAAALWGGMYVVSAWGFSRIPPVTLGFLRVAIGAATLLAVVRLRGHDPLTRTDWRAVTVLGGWVALTIVSQFLGTAWTSASQGSLLTVLTPVFTVLLGWAVLDEPVGRVKAVGLALAVVGTVVVLGGRYDVGAAFTDLGLGVGALLVASAAWAAYTVFGAPVVRRHSALVAATYSTLCSVPLLAVAAGVELVVTGRPLSALPTTLNVVGAVGYLGVAATAAAWYLWYKGLESVDAGTVAVFFFAQPVVGAVLGVLFLGESVDLAFVGGGVVMAVGITLVSRTRA
ncbi:DMT family transporter [Salinigranum halophilum]|uniref:DMT family transporter n=1 Tax=Salinigranum halophilum TaxID=2565931 RepID=UPI0010A7EB71|nr:EamA family transporter [Salinigranum halophilum]